MILAELFPYAHQIYNVLYVLTVLAIIALVVSENRNPVKSLAWVTILILLPIVGIILYLFFGRSLKSVRMISRKNRRRLRGGERMLPIKARDLDLSQESELLVQQINRLSENHFFTFDDIDIFTSGREKFEALKADLRAAERFIHLQYYIFENDRIGNEIAAILRDKAQHGVKVRVIYDHVGSFHFDMSIFKKMRKAGVEAYPFLKVTFPEVANRINWRNHRKVTVIDGKVGYIGGMNIADRYVTGTKDSPPWRDTHFRLTGNAVAALEYCFAVDWNFMRRELLTEHIPLSNHPKPFSTGMQLVASGPTGMWSNVQMVFIKALALAKRRVWIQTPYFLPSDSLLKTLQAAALAGVDVRIMIPRKTDSFLLRFASYSYIKECLLAGIKIYFYEPSMLHAKGIIIDDEIVTVGSTNFDFRSFEHNFECNIMVYDQAFNERMSQVFADDQHQCTRIILSHWKRRSVFQKAFESILRLMAPIL